MTVKIAQYMGKSLTSKYCSKCDDRKRVDEFSKNKASKDGLTVYCNQCRQELIRSYRKTKKGLASGILSHQRATSKKRGHPAPAYNLKQLHHWIGQQCNFEKLYADWVKSGYQTLDRPSCDRLDDYKPYTLENLRVVTWAENNSRSHADMKSGVNNKQAKMVVQHKGVDFVAKYHSVSEAARRTKATHAGISRCCNAKQDHSAGFQWSFA